ncbi:hypothetical protein PHYBLDRAFT_140249 [Phycomyces blakesleeanus NRRL 1555(-)]|uniref:Uncharacterized protein n=1 Tax=Phycomyces blakesleeanus (strain ATCC 8743b / DSM 1359 / FGSC 10004 / NBRC 33097 / NRRL 1555) TaxID=763407 RepID=A0A162YEV5_PHYB8|nr:hypothetical protein PHYBLDRAFT_140249 [Phycomyces blakesleeanus NRRL 1555(-)]OAD80245.1 hypothetical protein PHYBLDRAFT_140249 [Phycomyces blakesleeanus NRRL 1555(-)]|eukprot:XP_018298285.1 hypothetical protein PHYBLDRAFT_140249 [Phycomyces blakesleeanus NRRL 1555(-)]
MDVDTQYNQADSPDSNAAMMADNVLVDDEISKVNGNDSDIERDMNSVSGSGEEEGIKTDVEEFVNEDPFDAPNMPENPVHWFIATFAVLFISHYVVNKGAAILIEFINQLLKIYGKDFQLPKNCHKVYKQDVPLPTHCDFKKHGSRSACNCELMKVSSSGAMLKVVDTLCNVYGGAMWKELKDQSGVSFVDESRSLMLTMNINWFQPFDGVTYSTGAIYLAINNLPCEERFKLENVILLFTGITIPTFECPAGVNVRAALHIVACDIPTARKTSGFTTHNSTCACPRCVRQFTRLSSTNQVDFSGFDYLTWKIHSGLENRLHAEEWKSASTPSERHQLEIKNGI